jgi:hypothetical protein
MSVEGQSRHFGPVRRMSACPLTAAREQTFRDRSFRPKSAIGEIGQRLASVITYVLRSSTSAAILVAYRGSPETPPCLGGVENDGLARSWRLMSRDTADSWVSTSKALWLN